MATTDKPPKLSHRQRLTATLKVAIATYKAAPSVVVLQVAGSLISAVMPLVTTFFAAATTTALADAYAGKEGAGERAIELVIITAVLGLVMFVWSSLENYLNQAAEYKINAAISDKMYEHFMSLAFWRYDDKETADLYEKASRFARFFPQIFRELARIVSDFLGFVSGLIALCFVSWWLGLIAMIAIIPGVILQIRLTRLQTAHWKENIQPRRVVGWIEYGMMKPEKISELRLYGLVKRLLELRSIMRDRDEKVRIEFEKQFIWKRLAADVLETCAEVGALLWITLQIIAHQQPIGQFLFVQQVFGRATGGAKGLMNTLNSIDEELANLFDYQAFMDLPKGEHGSQVVRSAPRTVEVSHVSFSYPNNEKEVLRDVSLRVSRGQHIAIVGENGAGKSTLVKVLTGLYEPTKGELLLDGVPLNEFDIESWHRTISVLSQDFVKYDFANARDNVVYGDINKSAGDEPIDAAIKLAEADFLYKLPQGLNNYVDQWMEDDEGHKGQDLSGGQWQRLALARNFYRDAPIIILDEPTSAIDALAEARIFKHLFAAKDKTIIAISHRLSTVQKADVVYMIQDGKVVEQGTAKELIERRGAFYTMFESQL